MFYRLFLLSMLGLLVACDGSTDSQGSKAPAAPAPALVEVATAGAGSLSHTWRTLGEVVSLGDADLAAGASGPVVKVLAREGDRVKAGDVLLEVDSALASAQYASADAGVSEAEASLSLARSDFARLEEVGGDVLAKREVDGGRAQVAQLEARLAAQEAALRLAGERLRRHKVKAPFAGVITQRLVDPGDWVQEGQGVMAIVSAEEVEVRVNVSPEIARGLKEGDGVGIHGGGAIEGKVERIVPVLDPARRTSLIRLSPSSRPAWLMPGSSVEVALEINIEGVEAASIPRDALVLGPSSSRVVIDDDGTARILEVEVLGTSEDRALVTGVKPGESVVVKGNERVRPGQALRYVEVSASAEAPRE